MYIVTKEIIFVTDYLTRTTFPVGTHIDYKRTDNNLIVIWLSGSTPERSGYTGKDFDIEEYVKPINISEKSYHIQIERCDCVANTNRFLNTIDGNDFVEIIPLENNQYLVIYKKRGSENE